MRTKKVKPPHKKFEYTLDIAVKYDEIRKKDYISFGFATTKVFLSFEYTLTIDAVVKDNKMKFTIIGFSAPVNELGNSGNAGNEYRFYDFKSIQYKIEVHRRNLDCSKFRLNVNKRSKSEPIKLQGISRTSFIEIKTANDT